MSARWRTSRGTVRSELAADVIGSFPGFADYAGLIVDATVVLTDRYLLVDEGEPHGFGIAVTQLDRAGVDDSEVRVGFRQDGERRSFLLRVRRSRRSPRPRAAAVAMLTALRAAGVAGEFSPQGAGQSLSLSWEDASAVEHERVRWTRRVTAPIAVGQECTPSDAWASLESLLWTGPRSRGVNRLALGAVVSVARSEIAGSEPVPAIYLTIDDEIGGLIDLPFIFNLGDSGEANERDRTEFQNRIRGDHLPQSSLPARLQPWLSGDDDAIAAEPAASPAPGTDEAEPGVDTTADVSTESGDDDATARGPALAEAAPATPEEGQVFASWPTTEGGRGPLSTGARPLSGDRPGGINARRWRHTRGVDGAAVPDVAEEMPVAEPSVAHEGRDVVLAEWAGAEPAKAYAAWPAVDIAIDEQPAEPAPPPAPVAIPAYERAATATIDAVLFVISRRLEGHSAPPLTTVPPSSVDQAAALSELVELTAAGVMTPEEARNQKARLLAVGEGSVRLRTLLELSGAGHLSLAELVKKRDAILRGINYPAPEA